MKLVLAILAISICCFALIEAGPNRRMKRSLAQGRCPADRDCEEYAKEMVKGRCSSYDVGDGYFTISGCGSVSCGAGLKKTKEDLSKPYPDCCPTCI